ncbi:hypothetical protein ACI2LF_25705 [Kribbella sp. NPDC020789]
MTDIGTITGRQSASPWRLYQSDGHRSMQAARKPDGSYVRMLKDDLQKQHYAYDVALQPQGIDDTRALQLLNALLEDFDQTGRYHAAAELVINFSNRLLEESTDGKTMLLELYTSTERRSGWRALRTRRTNDPDQRGPLPALGFIPRWSVTKHRAGLSQAPSEGADPAIISQCRLHAISLRKENRRRWNQAITGLRQVDSMDIGRYDTSRLSWRGYDFSEQLIAQNLVIAATTAAIGWDARGTFNEYVTSPYVTYRQLRFAQFWVETIEDAVTFLNQFTGNVELYGDDAFTFALAGLPSPNDLTEAMRAIRSGSLSVEDAYDAYLFPKHAKPRAE